MKTILSVTALSLVAMFAAAGCAAEGVDGEDPGAAGEESALSEAQCKVIVTNAQNKSKAACAKSKTDADAKSAARGRLEAAVGSAVAGYEIALENYNGKAKATVSAAIRECSAMQCSNGLAQEGKTLGVDLCAVERSLEQGACYVRHVPAIRAAATDLDLSKEGAALDSAVGAMESQWFGLVKQEAALRIQHEACVPVAGSPAERAVMNAECRSSCSEADPLNPIAGSKAACSPAGYGQVKDDLGQLVTCGQMTRAITSLNVCECRETRGCTQFAAVRASSEYGKPCGANKTQKIVWDGAKQEARLECR